MKILAYVCKIVAIIIWLSVALLKVGFDIAEMRANTPPRDAPRDWATSAYYHRTYLEILMISVVALLAVVPNRWLVASRTTFAASVAAALVPLCVVLIHDWSSDPFRSAANYLDPGPWLGLAFVFAPLPLALAFSFWRQEKGAKVKYA